MSHSNVRTLAFRSKNHLIQPDSGKKEKFLVRKFIVAQNGFEADKVVHRDGSMTLSLDQLWPGFLSVVEIQGSLEIRKEFNWNKAKTEQIKKIPKVYPTLDIELTSTKYLKNALDLIHPKLDNLNLDFFNPETVFLDQIFPSIRGIPNISIVVHEATKTQIEDFKKSLHYFSTSLKFSKIEVFKFSIGNSVNPSSNTKYEEHSFQFNPEGILKKRKTSWDIVHAF